MFAGERHHRFLQHSDVCIPDNIASHYRENIMFNIINIPT